MKKCMNCGKEFPDNVKFCASCGSPLTVTEEQSSDVQEAPVVQEPAPTEVASMTQEPAMVEAAPVTQEPSGTAQIPVQAETVPTQQEGNGITETIKKLPPFVLPAVGIAAVVLIIILIAIFSGKGGYDTVSKSAIQIDYTEDGYVCFTTDGKTAVFGDEDDYYEEVGSSADGTVKLLCGEDDTYYILTIDDFVEIGEDIDRAFISANGAGVAYVAESSSKLGDLYLYNVKKESSEKIASDVLNNYFCISPDGKSLAFVSDYEGSSECKAYKSVNGKEPELIIKNSYPVAISDKGKLVYYCKNDSGDVSFYVAKGSDTNKLASDISRDITMYFNSDLSQVIYGVDGETYFSEKGKEKERIKKSSLSWVGTSDDCASISYSAYDANVVCLGVSSLEKIPVVLDETIYYYGGGSEIEKVVSDYSKFEFSSDMKGIMYLDYDTIYRIRDISKPEKKEVLAEDVDIRTFSATDDLSAFYYLDDDETLYYQKGDKDPKKIADDVYSEFAFDRKENVIFFLVDYSTKSDAGELYYSKKGGKKTEVKDGSDVMAVFTLYDSVFMLREEDEGYSYYLAKSGTKFNLLLENVNKWR